MALSKGLVSQGDAVMSRERAQKETGCEGRNRKFRG
jgi:hypothetical protein